MYCKSGPIVIRPSLALTCCKLALCYPTHQFSYGVLVPPVITRRNMEGASLEKDKKCNLPLLKMLIFTSIAEFPFSYYRKAVSFIIDDHTAPYRVLPRHSALLCGITTKLTQSLSVLVGGHFYQTTSQRSIASYGAIW